MPNTDCYNCAEVLYHASVWNYDDAQPVNSFHNHKLSDRGLSKLLLINELDECLLLAASSDGNVRIWKNFACKGGQKLVTAFSSVQGHRAAGRSIVIDWQQQSCYLYASGDMSSILVWDLDKEHFSTPFRHPLIVPFLPCLHLRSALDTLLLVLLMVLSGYMMFALLIGLSMWPGRMPQEQKRLWA